MTVLMWQLDLLNQHYDLWSIWIKIGYCEYVLIPDTVLFA